MAVITQPPLDDGDQAHVSGQISPSAGPGNAWELGPLTTGEKLWRRGGSQSQATCPLQLLCPVSWGDK